MTQKTSAPSRSKGTEAPRTSCTASRESGRFVIELVGELDVAAVDEAGLSDVLNSYRSDEPLDVVLDLGGVTFLDSAGLGWLMTLRSAATLADRKVRLRGSSPLVDKVLQMAGVRRYFPDEASTPGA
ncbi:MAG TPA: STAS domain-containing protein [Candidatus Angelobacter sp.]|nr:STAS domain-containing protein [Candidatus Angelobacter sp.]